MSNIFRLRGVDAAGDSPGPGARILVFDSARVPQYCSFRENWAFKYPIPSTAEATPRTGGAPDRRPGADQSAALEVSFGACLNSLQEI